MEAQMLVLSRKRDQKILLKLNENEEIELTVVRIDANKVRLGIEASDSVQILRSELVQKTTESEDVSKKYASASA
jgi:carbon storage regulator CsrA